MASPPVSARWWQPRRTREAGCWVLTVKIAATVINRDLRGETREAAETEARLLCTPAEEVATMP